MSDYGFTSIEVENQELISEVVMLKGRLRSKKVDYRELVELKKENAELKRKNEALAQQLKRYKAGLTKCAEKMKSGGKT